MSAAWQFYVSTLLVYLGGYIIAVWGLNIQFGIAGLNNFAYILFKAAGAYTAAVLTLGPSAPGGFQQYVGGARWPFPLPFLAAGVVGAILSVLVGIVGLRRLRADYQAMVLLVVSLMATSFVTNKTNLFNGPAGLALVPKPLSSAVGLSLVGYQWFYVALSAAFCLLLYFLVHRLTTSPLARAMRAVRENEHAAAALGKNVLALRLVAFAIGGGLAGISGALVVSFIGTWSPAAWRYQETFILFTAILVGGTANTLGVTLGALLVPVTFVEVTRYLPNFGYPGLVAALQWVGIGVLALLFLWLRPRGVIPERRRRFPPIDRSSDELRKPAASIRLP